MVPRPSLRLALSILCYAAGCDGSATSMGDDAGTRADGAPPLAAGRSGVSFQNVAGDTVLGTIFIPEGSERVPGVLVLHGSGGLFDEPEDPAHPPTDPATAELERQFEEWSELLTGEGYVALMPGSFFSRGFFDWNEDAPEGVSDRDRLVFRVFDAIAALTYLCDHPRVDCARMAVIGFSNGASTTLLSLADHLDLIPDLDGLTVDPSMEPRLGIAYYPGCGLDGLVSLREPAAYVPRVPLQIFHAEEDPLLEHCPTRVAQADTAAGGEGLLDLFVYESAGHGFDSTPATSAEEAARDDARSRVLAMLGDSFAQ